MVQNKQYSERYHEAARSSSRERAIKTIKKRLDDKLASDEASYPDKDPASYWTEHMQEAVDWYNKENVQATPNMKPVDAENQK